LRHHKVSNTPLKLYTGISILDSRVLGQYTPSRLPLCPPSSISFREPFSGVCGTGQVGTCLAVEDAEAI
jgi:hypothetical protein